MTGKPLYICQWLGRREYTHLCIHILTFGHTKCTNSWTRTLWKRKQLHDITLLKGKQTAAAIYWGKTSFHFDGRREVQGARRKWSCLQNQGSQCWVKNGPDFPGDVVFIMPTSVLPISRWGGNWSVRPLGALRVYDFSCCCHCPGLYWFVKHSFHQRQTADLAALCGHGKGRCRNKSQLGELLRAGCAGEGDKRRGGEESSAFSNDLRIIICCTLT